MEKSGEVFPDLGVEGCEERRGDGDGLEAVGVEGAMGAIMGKDAGGGEGQDWRR